MQTNNYNILNQPIQDNIFPKRLNKPKLNSATLFSSAFQSENSLSAMKKEISFFPSPKIQFKTLPSTESDYNSRKEFLWVLIHNNMPMIANTMP